MSIVITLIQDIWYQLFGVSIPIWGGVSFGEIMIAIFIGMSLATYFSRFLHRGE